MRKKLQTLVRDTSTSSCAVLYARVSSKEQEREGFSIPAQLKALRTYADENRVKVLREFVDIETAKRTGRAGFAEMIQLFKNSRTIRPARREDGQALAQPQRLADAR